MAYCCDRPDFAVRVEGRFVESSEWVVDAVIRYRTDLDVERRQRAFVEARSAVVIGILRESRRGRHLGARRVEVRIGGDASVAGVFTMNDRSVPSRAA